MPRNNPLAGLVQQFETNMGLKIGAPESVAKMLHEFVRRFGDFQDQFETIDTDKRLTTEGKWDAKENLARKTLKDLEIWHAPLRKNLDANESGRLQTLREAVTPKQSSDPAARMEGAFLRQEIRRKAESLNELGLEILYRQGSGIVRRALEELPKINPETGYVSNFVSAELRDEVLLESAREVLPEEADLLDDVRNINEKHEILLAAFHREVEKVAPSVAEQRRSIKIV